MPPSLSRERHTMSVIEFLAFLDERPDCERWELVDGEPVMMVNVTRAHSLITLNIATLLHPLARRRGCETHSADFFVSGAEASGFMAVPDVFVRCGQADDKARLADDPVIVVEVLSPSTIRHDRVRKFDRYTAIASVRQIVLVYQDEVRVESFLRDNEDWPMAVFGELGHALPIAVLESELPLNSIYAGTALAA